MTNDTFDVALHAGDIVYASSNGTGNASYKTYNDWFFDIYAAWLPFRAFYPAEGNHDSPRRTATALRISMRSRCRPTGPRLRIPTTRSGTTASTTAACTSSCSTPNSPSRTRRVAPSSCRGSSPISRRHRSRGKSRCSIARRIRPAANTARSCPSARRSRPCSSATACSWCCRPTSTPTSGRIPCASRRPVRRSPTSLLAAAALLCTPPVPPSGPRSPLRDITTSRAW